MKHQPIQSLEQKLLFKKAVFKACEEMVEERIATSSLAMQHAQESANSEDKSSAGDKYETGRAMGQRERDMHAIQLKQNQNDLDLLRGLHPTIPHLAVGPGSVLKCKDFFLFIALGLGSTTVESQKVFLLSPLAPLALLLKGKKANDSFSMGGKEMVILDVF